MNLAARTITLDPIGDAGGSGPSDAVRWLPPTGSRLGSGRVVSGPALEVTKAIADARHQRPDGAPPLAAFGSIPFRGDALLSVPAIQIVTQHGQSWATLAVPHGKPPGAHDVEAAVADLLATTPATRSPGHYDVRASQPADAWCATVGTARERVRAGDAVKVVLGREIVVSTDRPLDPSVLAMRLHTAFPSCTAFHVDGLVGASPELLVSRSGRRVRSHPLAGTAPRSGDPSADARLAASLLASAKERIEHQITIARVHETLLPHCSYLDAEAEPSVVAVANVQHLGTMVEGHLSDPAPSSFELAVMLHPTPAVGGEPRDAALALIDELEPGDRGRYAGAVGWVDAAGDGEWMVAIRCAELVGAVAHVWAGVGIVEDSDPTAELAETRAKLRAVLGAIIEP
ncbi:MAG TPA: isochorismate synthase [Acidimicrobiales bacterium]